MAVDWQGILIRHVTYPLWMRMSGLSESSAYYRRFRRLDDQSRAEVNREQEDAVASMLATAYRSTDYYRALFDGLGVRPEGGLETLAKLPTLNKHTIRAMGPAAFVNRQLPASELYEASTGGSTGLPLSFVRSRRCLALRKAQERVVDAWIGLRPGDAVGLFVAASHHVDGESWKSRLRNETFERLLRCDPGCLDDEYLGEFHLALLRYRPRFLKCFPSSLAVYISFLRRHGLEPPSVVGITATGETLHTWQRRLFESTFGAPVYERYGTKESGLIAAQCSLKGAMHVFSPGAIVEIVRADGSPCRPGEQGAILVTDLFNDGMPFLRYAIGDQAIAADDASCACGLPYPRIEKILGRDRDIIVDAEGTPRPGYLFVELITAAGLDVQFQIHQRAAGSIEVRVLRSGGSMPAELDELLGEFERLLRGGRAELVVVDDLPRDASGKYPYVVSEPGRALVAGPSASPEGG